MVCLLCSIALLIIHAHALTIQTCHFWANCLFIIVFCCCCFFQLLSQASQSKRKNKEFGSVTSATLEGTPSPSTSLQKHCWLMQYDRPLVRLKASFSRFSSTSVTADTNTVGLMRSFHKVLGYQILGRHSITTSLIAKNDFNHPNGTLLRCIDGSVKIRVDGSIQRQALYLGRCCRGNCCHGDWGKRREMQEED